LEQAMERKQIIGNVLAFLVAAGFGGAAFWVGYHYLGGADSVADFLVQIFAGIAVAIVMYVAVWGHFQGDFRGGLPEKP
jgi:hypothetical protein